MIALSSPAKVECDSPGCPHHEPVKLTLLASGGFGFAPTTDALKRWQFGTSNPLGPIVARCPDHHVLVAQAPAGPRLITTEH